MPKLTALFLLFLSSLSFGAERLPFGEVKLLHGTATDGAKSLKEGSKVFLGDTISTGKNSLVRIVLSDRSAAMQVGPEGSIKLEQGEHSVNTVDLLKGFVLSTIKPTSPTPDQIKYQVRARGVSMGVRGTTFFAKVEANGDVFQCLCRGKVETKWKNGQQILESKNHDFHRVISVGKSEPVPAEMGADHTDAEITELQSML